MYRNVFFAILLCLAMPITALADEQTNQISGFRDYEWGTSFNEIFDMEVNDDMVLDVDYCLYDENSEGYDDLGIDGLTAITILDSKAGGFDTSANFIFIDAELTMGYYGFEDINNDDCEIIFQKYISVYGDPAIQNDIGWGPAAIWVDDTGNIITMSKMFGAFYFSNGSQMISLYNEQFENYYGFSLELEINKIYNIDGI